MKTAPSRSQLALLGGAFVLTGTAMLWYAVGAIGAGWELPSFTPPLTRGAQIYQASCSGCHRGSTGGGIGDHPPCADDRRSRGTRCDGGRCHFFPAAARCRAGSQPHDGQRHGDGGPSRARRDRGHLGHAAAQPRS